MYTPPAIQHPRHLEHHQRNDGNNNDQEQLSEPLLSNGHNDPYSQQHPQGRQQQQQHHHQNHHQGGGGGSPTSSDPDDTLIWDQLNDAQSREVQQHQSRFHTPSSNSRSRPGVVLLSLAQTSGERFVAATMSAAEAAKEAYTSAWNRYPTYTPARQRDGNNGLGILSAAAEDSLDREFGLQRPDPQVPMSETLLSGDNDNSDIEGGGRHRSSRQQSRQASSPSLRSSSHSNNPFILLSPFRMIPSERDGWGAVSNLDLFLTNLYSYYYHRGWVPIVCRGIVETFIMIFTLWLSVFLLRYIDWHSLALCHEEATCKWFINDII